MIQIAKKNAIKIVIEVSRLSKTKRKKEKKNGDPKISRCSMNQRRSTNWEIWFGLNRRARPVDVKKRESASGRRMYASRIDFGAAKLHRCFSLLVKTALVPFRRPPTAGRPGGKWVKIRRYESYDRPGASSTPFSNFVSPEAHPRAIFRWVSLPDFADSRCIADARCGVLTAREITRGIKRLRMILSRIASKSPYKEVSRYHKIFLNDTSDIYGYPISRPIHLFKAYWQTAFCESVHIGFARQILLLYLLRNPLRTFIMMRYRYLFFKININ